MIKNHVHIVVKDGLVQEVYTDIESEVIVMIHDLDCQEDEVLFAETKAFADNLPSFAKKVY